ncbi:sulfurtransferase [Streptomyces sp. NPDC015144]|uniref:sulfurtransferase n=1 Tax=Streptomyces sp. NPDC015144 TaxID=3364944 RepID=UPI0036FAF2B6
MSQEPSGPLVCVDWLAARIGAPDGPVVLDASVGAHRGGERRIPGARVFDIDGALSDPSVPLAHTMPGADRFTRELRALGVNDADTVVVYDGAGIYSSARAWWMLRAMGFDRVAVLDGGLPAWTAAGLPLESAPPAPPAAPGDFTARPRAGMFVTAEEVARTLTDPAAVVLDARSPQRYAGTVAEPRPGLRAGHMPGAVNLPFDTLQHEGRMRPADELRAALAARAGERERLVLSCGSGVTACVLALAAELAGYRGQAVYDGSWSEWGMASGPHPVATGADGPAPAVRPAR